MLFRNVKSRWCGIVCFLLLAQWFAVVPPGSAAVVTTPISVANAAADAAIDSSNADKNLNAATGSSTGLYSVSSSGSKEMDVLYKFSVDPDLVNAPDYAQYQFVLSLAAKMNSSGTNTPLSVCAAGTAAGSSADWSESTLTWNLAAANNLSLTGSGVSCLNDDNATSPSFTVTTPNASSPAKYQIDVTDYVKRFLAAGSNVITFVVGDKSKKSISVNLYSKESAAANMPQLIVQTAVTDNSAPFWDAGDQLKAANLGSDFILLAWPAARDADTYVKSYNVYNNGSLIASVPAAASPGIDSSGTSLPPFNNYKLTGLTSGETYQLKVEAVDAGGNKTDSGSLSLSKTTLLSPPDAYPLEPDSVTASGDDGNVAANTADDNLYTRWSSSNDPWIQYDLGSVLNIGYVGIAFYNGDGRATSLDIDLSADGTAWDRVFSGYSVTMLDMQPFRFTPQAARYVRITGHGNTTNAFTSFTEVKVYPPYPTGDTPVAIVPNIPPGRPPGAVDFTKPGLTNADGTVHAVHTPHAVTGRTIDVTAAPYNADSAGQTDAAAAIRAALQAAQPGDEVYLPNGTYLLDSTLDGLTNLTLKSNVNLRGQSQDGTVLKTTLDGVKNSAVLKVPNQNHIQISDLTITSVWDDGGGTRYPTSTTVNNPYAGGPENGITVQSGGNNSTSYNVTIDRVTVEKYYRMGVRIDGSHDIVVRNSTFRNTTDMGPSGAGYGVVIQGIAKQNMLGYENDPRWNLIENNYFGSPNAGEVRVRHGALIQNYAHNNVVRGNTFNNTALDSIDLHGEFEYLNEVYDNEISNVQGGGLGLGNTGGTAPSNHGPTGPGNYIHDNTLINTRDGINITMGTPGDTVTVPEPATVVERNTIKNTTITNATGIKILNAIGVLVKDNIIENNSGTGFWGIYLGHDNGDTKVDDPSNPWGKYMAGDPSAIEISGNTVAGNTGGINIQAGSGIQVLNNQVNHNGNNYLKADQLQIQEVWPAAVLSNLAVSEGAIRFDPAVTSYSVNVAHAVTSIDITPAASDAAIEVNGTATVSGSVYTLSPLAVGENTVTIQVTPVTSAVYAAPSTYTLLVNRAAGVQSNNADLSGLTVSAGTLTPAFNAGVTSYSVSVPSVVSSIDVTPTAADPAASLKINGTASVSGAVYGQSLNVGNNAITIEVTAESGIKKAYQIGVIRSGSRSHGSGNNSSAGGSGSSASAPSEPIEAGSASTSQAAVSLKTTIANLDGQSVAQAEADGQTITDALQNNDSGRIKLVVDPGQGTTAEAAAVTLTNSALQKLASASGLHTISVDTPFGSYELPVQQLHLQQLSSALGVPAEQVSVEVFISKDKAAAEQAEASGRRVLGAAEFTLKVKSAGGKSVELVSFTQYVPRIVKAEAGAGTGTPNGLHMAAVRVETDSQGNAVYQPVPFNAAGNEVTIYSRTNSTYLLLANSVSFRDALHHWAQADIEAMGNKMIVQGVSQDEFRPDQAVTRAEFAALLARALGLKADVASMHSFTDVHTGDWFEGQVYAAAEAGIVSGYDDQSFRPDQLISRQEMAVMIYHAMQFAGFNDGGTSQKAAFADEQKMEAWAKESILAMAGMQIVDGVGSDLFDPTATATRAQSAVILNRMLSKLQFTK